MAGTPATTSEGRGQSLLLLMLPLWVIYMPFAHHLESLGGQAKKQNRFNGRWVPSAVLAAPFIALYSSGHHRRQIGEDA